MPPTCVVRLPGDHPRKLDPEATLDLIDRHRATGLVVVPVMFDRIMDLPPEVRRRYSGRSCGRPRHPVRGNATRRRHRVHGRVRRRDLQQLQRDRGGHDRHRAPGRPARRAGHGGRPEGAPKSASWTRTSTSCPPARSAPSTCATTPSSTATPRAATKDFHAGFMSSGDVGYLDVAAGCSWSAATTR